MSNKTALVHSLAVAANRSGGASLTRLARDQTFEALGEYLRSINSQVSDPSKLTTKHILGWIEAQKAAGISQRTLQNRMSHIRCALRGLGKGNFAASGQISNSTLGISGASRLGTKTAHDPATLRSKVQGLEPGIQAALRLQQALGLRAKESVMSGPYLAQWADQIRSRGSFLLLSGAKGGRPREVWLPKSMRAGALEAIKTAQAALGGGNQLIPSSNLKQALRSLQNSAARSGFTGAQSMHSLRYAFAREYIAQFKAENQFLNEKQALAACSLALGHGDGRGAYVKSVYLR